MLALIVVSLGVGFLCGCCGIGGFLLIPALVCGVGLDIRTAMGTALFSFIFTGLSSIWLYQRRGSIDWPVSLAICLGGLPSGFLGAIHKSLFSVSCLNLILAAIIMFAGYNGIRPVERSITLPLPQSRRARLPVLIGIGAAVGYLAGLTGAGGPVLSIPVLMLSGFPPLAAVSASYAVQVAGALSGSIGNALYGYLDLYTGIRVSVIQIVGVAAGAYAAHRLPASGMRLLLALLCIVTGAYMAAGALFSEVLHSTIG